MGLDMYVYKTKQLVPQFGFEMPDDTVQIATGESTPISTVGWKLSTTERVERNCSTGGW
jgi:hypothetical protein